MPESSRAKADIGVAFVYATPATFVEADFALLCDSFRVLPYQYVIERGAGRSFLRFLFSRRDDYDVIFVWFADVYATLAVDASKILGKSVVIVVGGYDTTYIPSIGYGMLSTRRKRSRALRAYTGARRILAVDGSLKAELRRTLLLDGSNIEVVPTGYDAQVYRPSGPKDEGVVLTVGTVDAQNIERKGFLTFVRTAQVLPNFEFRIAGALTNPAAELLRAQAPPNVRFLGRLPREDLIAEYQRAKVYAQLSLFEGLPNALAEAMLCECVPVGTPVFGIPTLIADCGFYATVGDPVTTARAISEASSSGLGPRARKRIVNCFDLERRGRALYGIITRLVGE